MKSLINKKACKEYALAQSQKIRNGRFTRVSKEFLDDLEALLRSSIAARVHRAPTKGKTL